MGKIRQIWSHCMGRESPKWKQKHRHKVLQLLVPHTYLLACLRASSPPWEFLLTSSATRCWNATKKTGWPNFPKVAQKVATAVFLKRDGFQNSPKHYHTFGISLPENLWPRYLIFFQFGHPAVSHGRHEATILLYNLYSSSSFSSLCCCWKRITIMFC